MPLEQRVIEPIAIGRHCCPAAAPSVSNELECVTNGSLANVIRQLGSLALLAGDLFEGLLVVAGQLLARAQRLQSRLHALAARAHALDAQTDDAGLSATADVRLKKWFRSSQAFSQAIVSRESMPAAIEAVYVTCERPPALSKLNRFRDDGRDGLKFYTDPNYFFELWKREMLDVSASAADDQHAHHRKEARRQNRKIRAPQSSRERLKQLIEAKGEIIETRDAYGLLVRPNSLVLSDANASSPTANTTPTRRQTLVACRPSQPPPAPPSNVPVLTQSAPSLPPPPPPPPPPMSASMGSSSATTDDTHDAVSAPQAPPQSASMTSAATTRESSATLTASARSDLLAAIREGIKLKRVEDMNREIIIKSTPLHDVASILARRVAMELSSSESESDGQDDDGNADDLCGDVWDDESEC